ncbi:DNA cytosine methyltransferase [Nocardioides yefusunii]|uniref:DNA (cytosine-5-)-methyltransferase n=1 Tax=Nocardioides yefusunii TaxID=2500546 RepID=A0ABW1QXD9_9ACTN|nr:DNA cytosine methyltransferase [Nocardioides yefusunii]
MSITAETATEAPRALEFFAGIGLARMGLEKAGFEVAWANDYEPSKMAMYDAQFGVSHHKYALGDVSAVKAEDLPKGTSLAWASSPCTDLSLAGGRAGLNGQQSGTFWHFVRLLKELGEQRPPVAVLENVVGLATSHNGEDLRAAVRAFNELGYSVDVLAINARHFLPQSRPRIFLVAAQTPPESCGGPQESELRPAWLRWVHADPELVTHRAPLPDLPKIRTEGLGQLVETMSPHDERWWDSERTDAFTESLSPTQRERVDTLISSETVRFRTAYRRTRHGKPVWEVRADDISGCLRTARGGSSKQAVVRLGRNKLQVRWMTPLEYARLMGAGDYNLSKVRNNQALFGFGDAVAVPAVTWLAENYLTPLVKQAQHFDK